MSIEHGIGINAWKRIEYWENVVPQSMDQLLVIQTLDIICDASILTEYLLKL